MLGNRQGAVGQPLRVTWRETWEQLRPITQKTMSGEAVYHEIFRSKPPDMADRDRYLTFRYSPIRDENGTVLGMIDTVIETTEAVRGRQRLASEWERDRCSKTRPASWRC